MERFEQDALIVTLVDELTRQGSWCGETHVQKAIYFLQEMAGVPSGFEFVLYKHGPFSFDLRDELTAMRADRLLELEVHDPSYGPSLKPGGGSQAVLSLFRGSVATARPAIKFVAERFGERNVTELERLGTALYVARKHRDEESARQVEQIVSLKPHISRAQAESALKMITTWQAEAAALELDAAR
jgi:hypothetical protein